MKLRITFFVLLFFASVQPIFAEGSKQLMPDINSRAALCTVTDVFGGFATNISTAQNRLYFNIKNAASEVVYLGFSLGYGTGISDILGEGSGSNYYFQIKDPSGNIVYGPQLMNSNVIPSGAAGYSQVMAGPYNIAGASGYIPFVFTPAAGVTGDYYIEFNRGTTFSLSQCSFDYWDITVADVSNPASPVAKDGRLWSKAWGFYSKDYTSSGYSGTFKGKMYSYTVDGTYVQGGIVHSVDFTNSGFRGGSFRIGLSSKGPGNTGNYTKDRQSLFGVRTVGKEYKVFLNNPDTALYPSGSIPVNNLTFSSSPITCTGSSIGFNFSLLVGGIVEILLDFNNNGVYDPGTSDLVLGQSLPAGPNTINWDLKDGLGNTIDPGTQPAFKLLTTFGNSVHHLTVADVEYFSGGFLPQVVRPNPTGFIPKLYYDDIDIRTNSATNINRKYPDTTLAYTDAAQPVVTQLNGCTGPCHAWNNFGTAATGDRQDNNIQGYGNGSSINTWWYSFLEQKEYLITLPSCGLQGAVVNLSGNVYNDGNGLKDSTVNGTATNLSGQLYAQLINSSNVAIAVVPVANDGTFTFTGVQAGAYTVVINTSSTLDPSPGLPQGWINTGEYIGTGTGNDGTINGISATVIVSTSDISGVNFGIEQLPTSDAKNAAYPVNTPGVMYAVPGLTGTDPEDGSYGDGNTYIIKTLPVNAVLYYNGVAVSAGDTISNFTASLLTIDPSNGTLVSSFTYVTIDAAGKEDPTPASVTITWSGLLPVILLDFTAAKNNKVAALQWTTNQEISSAYIEVERSATGNNYGAIGRVSTHNSRRQANYTFNDFLPLNGNNYYRLRLVDRNGTFEYSPVRLINFEATSNIIVYPNPFGYKLTINFPGNWMYKNVQATVINQLGQVVFTRQIGAALQNETLELSTLPDGVYTLKLQSSGNVTVFKKIQVKK